MAMKKPIQVHDRRSFLLQSAAGLVVAGAPAAQLAASSAREPLPVKLICGVICCTYNSNLTCGTNWVCGAANGC